MWRKHLLQWSLVVLVFILVANTSFLVGFERGKQFPQNLIVEGVTNLEEGKDETVDFGTFWQAWKVVENEHLKGKEIGNNEKTYGAIRGLLGSLKDPYSDFFSPEEDKKFREDIQGNFGGIGAEIGFRKDQLVIVAPLKDTPASRADLRPGDRIIKIDDTVSDGLSVDRAVGLIRGPEGTTVKLMIVRDGWDIAREFKIVREQITVPTLEWEMKNKNLAHFKLYSFNGNTTYLFVREARKALKEGAQGMVLDLRNNPGGYLGVAVEVSSLFLTKDKLVVKEVGRDGPQEEFKTTDDGALRDLPVVILINEASASASEILAGALRVNRGVKLIGTKSFGKGTVQTIKNLRDGSSVKITIAHWVLADGTILEGQGLVPNVEVALSEEDIKNKHDPQLEKAIEILLGQL